MSDSNSAKVEKPQLRAVNDIFDAKATIESSHTSELVIALCGPIGSPVHNVAKAIKARLESDFGYQKCEIIRLSQLIEKHHAAVPETPKYERTKGLIDGGDQLRQKHGSSVLAEIAISQIAFDRIEAKLQADKDGTAEDRFLPRRVCHIIDSIKNQDELDILKSVYRDMLYFVGVYAPLSARVKSLEKNGLSQAQIFTLVDRDSGEELTHGQTVRKTFPLADFFLRIDSDTDSQVTRKVDRFLHLVLGTKILTPTLSETAMYTAASAAGNSACLSRQVGAALTDRDGRVISVGWNDVPKFGGDLYGADPLSDPNSDKDLRCWNLDGGVCFNDQEKRVISELLVSSLVNGGLVTEDHRNKAIKVVMSDTKVKDLIEFSRAVHAEMHAILNAKQLAGASVKGGKLFVTTYPCHSCARHIIAAGISEVYYIEPYRKSLATKLHSDAITETDSEITKVRVLPYDGVAPSRYLKLFRVPQDSRKENGKMRRIDPRKATPRFDKTLEALPQLEALVVKGLHDKNVIGV